MGEEQINKLKNLKQVELETKILEVNPALIIQQLQNLGAQKILDCTTYIEGFDFVPESKEVFTIENSSTRFQELFSTVAKISTGKHTLISHGSYLRLREEGLQCELILKTPSGNSSSEVKSEQEISIPIVKDEWDKIREELISRGLKRIIVQEKKRTSFIYPLLAVRYDIDTWPKIPPYLEVEGKNREAIAEALSLVGLSIDQGTSLTGKQIFEKYNVDPRDLKFTS